MYRLVLHSAVQVAKHLVIACAVLAYCYVMVDSR